MGSGKGGKPLSSTSNLSALAPPFTLERLSPMLNPTHVFHHPEMSYVAEPFSSTCQFSRSSVPEPELDTIIPFSTGTGSTPFSDYSISASMSVIPSGAYWSAPPSQAAETSGTKLVSGGEVYPYYFTHVPSVIGEDSLVIQDHGHWCHVIPPFQLDEPHWDDNMGFNYGKMVKNAEPFESFSWKNEHVGSSDGYKSKMSEGRDENPRVIKSQEIPGVPYGNSDRVSGSEVHSKSLRAGNLKHKSRPEKNFNLLPYDITETHIFSSCSVFPESHYLDQSREITQNVSSFRNSYSPCEKYYMPVDSIFTSSVSAMRSSSTVVIRPPPPASDDILGKSATSYRPIHHNAAVVQQVSCDHTTSSNQKDLDLKPISDLNVGSILSSSVKELPTPLHVGDTFHHKIKARNGSQVPNINVSGDFASACATIQVAFPAEDSLDFADHHDADVDSPCWKGASTSQFSAFDSGPGNSLNKILSDGEEHRNLLSFYDSTRAFSENIGECYDNDDNECERNDVLTFPSRLHTNCPSREQCLTAVAKNRGGEGAQSNESDLPNYLKGGFDVNVLDSHTFNVEDVVATTLYDLSEGDTVPVHEAEKVLVSPSSPEDGGKRHKLQAYTKLDVQTIIKAMDNLSELLCCYLSDDASALEEKDTEILKKVISNLDSCARINNDLASNENKSRNHVRDVSEKRGKSHDAGTVSDGPHEKYEAMNSHVQHDCTNRHGEDGNNIFSAYKFSKSPVFAPLNVTKDGDMARVIKKVFDENFHSYEEIHPQALLFKSLWLEAEAKLCSVSCAALFDRIELETGQFETGTPKDSENAESVISGFNIVKSRVDELPLISTGKEQPNPVHVQMLESTLVGPNILKPREGSSGLIMSDQSEEVFFNANLKLRGSHQTSVAADGKYGLCLDAFVSGKGLPCADAYI